MQKKQNTWEQKYYNLFNLALTGYCIHDFSGIILDINDFGCSLLGSKKKQIVETNLNLYTAPESQNLLFSHLKSVFNYSKRTTTELKFKCMNSTELFVLLTSQKIGSLDNIYCLTAITDITKQRSGKFNVLPESEITRENKTYEELNSLLEELASKNEELENFSRTVSHDLREPIRMISLFSELLYRKYYNNLDANGLEYLNIILNAAKRANNLVVDLFKFSRIENKKDTFTRISCEKIKEVLSDLSVLINEAGGEVTVETLPEIKGNESQIRELFQNLIINSIKFRKGNNLKIDIKCELSGNYWLFSITDNGIGIEKIYFDQIFKIFLQINESRKNDGTGIGLSICKKIVELHNGKIWVDSEHGIGSTFYFTIPA